MLTVYSKAQCSFCEVAKKYLKEKDIAFEEKRIDLDPEAFEFITSKGYRSVPQIFKGKEIFVEGGAQALTKMSKEQIVEKLNEKTLDFSEFKL